MLDVEFNKLNASTGTILLLVAKIVFIIFKQEYSVLSNFIWETQIFEYLQFQKIKWKSSLLMKVFTVPNGRYLWQLDTYQFSHNERTRKEYFEYFGIFEMGVNPHHENPVS